MAGGGVVGTKIISTARAVASFLQTVLLLPIYTLLLFLFPVEIIYVPVIGLDLIQPQTIEWRSCHFRKLLPFF